MDSPPPRPLQAPEPTEAEKGRPSDHQKQGVSRKWWRRLLLWVGNRELSFLLFLFLLSGALWAFVSLAEEVMEGDTEAFDDAILLSLREPADVSDPLGPGWLEEAGRDLTALGGIPVLGLVTLTVCSYLVLVRRRQAAAVVAVATVGALLLSTVLKDLIDRTRPDLVPHGARVYTASFPSAHAMNSASIYLTLGALLAQVEKRRLIKMFILTIAATTTLLVGISRVYLGVHWPTDVLAGWTAGAGWATLCWLLARWLQRRGSIVITGKPGSRSLPT